MKTKKYQIKTVQDIIDCTNEANLENFLTDLKSFITTAHALKTIIELVDQNGEQKKYGTDGYTWIDDGKQNTKITIETE